MVAHKGREGRVRGVRNTPHLKEAGPNIHTYVRRTLLQGFLPQTDRASAFVTQKFLAREGGVEHPVCKIFLTSSLITVQNLVAVSHTVRAHVGGPEKFLEQWNPGALG